MLVACVRMQARRCTTPSCGWTAGRRASASAWRSSWAPACAPLARMVLPCPACRCAGPVAGALRVHAKARQQPGLHWVARGALQHGRSARHAHARLMVSLWDLAPSLEPQNPVGKQEHGRGVRQRRSGHTLRSVPT